MTLFTNMHRRCPDGRRHVWSGWSRTVKETVRFSSRLHQNETTTLRTFMNERRCERCGWSQLKDASQ